MEGVLTILASNGASDIDYNRSEALYVSALAKSWTRTFLIMCAEPLRRTMCSCAVPNMCP